MPGSVLKGLGEKFYEKRKNAALEIEKSDSTAVVSRELDEACPCVHAWSLNNRDI